MGQRGRSLVTRRMFLPQTWDQAGQQVISLTYNSETHKLFPILIPLFFVLLSIGGQEMTKWKFLEYEHDTHIDQVIHFSFFGSSLFSNVLFYLHDNRFTKGMSKRHEHYNTLLSVSLKTTY